MRKIYCLCFILMIVSHSLFAQDFTQNISKHTPKNIQKKTPKNTMVINPIFLDNAIGNNTALNITNIGYQDSNNYKHLQQQINNAKVMQKTGKIITLAGGTISVISGILTGVFIGKAIFRYAGYFQKGGVTFGISVGALVPTTIGGILWGMGVMEEKIYIEQIENIESNKE